MYWKKSLTAGAALGLSALLLSPTWTGTAHADIYHAVAQGETLRTIAARYHTSPAALRTANSLTNATDDAALPAMLLRVPEATGASHAAPAAPINAAPAPATSAASPAGWGKISSTTAYKVQAGDSWESIAESYSRAGYIVTAEMIRRENPGVELAANATLQVPLHRIYYNAVAKALPDHAPAASEKAAVRPVVRDTASTPAYKTLGGAVAQPSAPDLPVARLVAEEKPTRIAQRIVKVEQAVTPRAEEKEQKPAQRGPSVLGSRGRSGPSGMGGVRVLGQDESAVVEPPAPQSRVIRPTQPAAEIGEDGPAPATPQPKVARVAEIIKPNARIRRLPEASAATLYNTPPGTDLAVIGSKGAWISILMSDRSTGWLPAHYVKFTGAKVDISSIKLRDPGPITRTVRSSTTGDMSRYAAASPVVAEALKWLGTPYVWGGTTQRGVDCSGLVQHAFAACGYRLPRVSRDQAKVGQPVDVSDLQPGDRVYFSASGRRIDHTGIYMGDGLVVHASGSGRRVMVSRLFDRGLWNIYVGARR